MASKLRVGVLFGGRSCEHEVSVQSARTVLEAIDRDRYDAVPIGISRSGRWRVIDALALPSLRAVEDDSGTEVEMLAHPRGRALVATDRDASPPIPTPGVDVFFPLVHGPLGEDGTVQGLLELAGAPYVGAGVLGSAVGMDKAVMKALLAHAGLPVCPYRVVTRTQWREQPGAARRACEEGLGYPWFVKPAGLGSSVGVSKVHGPEAFTNAMDEAARYGRKILVEEAVAGAREIEIAVLGNGDPIASVPGEIVTDGEFYDYRAKYQDDTTRLIIPAPIDSATSDRLRALALVAFRALDGAGLARIDFLVGRDNGSVFVNEANTLPGFTHASMYPKLWGASGLDLRALIDRLIELALDRHVDRMENRTVFRPQG